MRRRGSRTHLRLRTQHLLEARAYLVDPVETYNPRTKRLRDLFEIFDLLAMKVGVGIVGIQVSPASRLADHRRKMFQSSTLIPWIQSGGRAWIVSLRLRETRVRLLGGSWDVPQDDGKRGWIILFHEWTLNTAGIPVLRLREMGRLAFMMRKGLAYREPGEVKPETPGRLQVDPGPGPREERARRKSSKAAGLDRRGEEE